MSGRVVGGEEEEKKKKKKGELRHGEMGRETMISKRRRITCREGTTNVGKSAHPWNFSIKGE